MEAQRKVSRRALIRLFIAPFLMFGFAYAMVPLYDVFCDITGLNGRSGRVATAFEYNVDPNRVVNVNFYSSTMAGFPLTFSPVDDAMEVVPGSFYTATYQVVNNTDQVIVAQAVPSVAPKKAALYFKKLECFCFERQIFNPHEIIEMQVRFVIEPDLESDVRDIDLSYNIFKLQDTENKI